MEYRLKYRDIPWGVALGVLPGKIIGALFINPFIRLKRNRAYRAKVWFSRLFVTLLVLVVVAIVFLVADQVTQGAVTARLDQTLDWWMSINQSIPAAPIPTEIGLR